MIDLPNAILDPKTGMVTYKGEVMTYAEWLAFVEEEREIWQEEIGELRDYSSDLQCLWGNKSNGFKDDWLYIKRPLRRIKGYPSEVEGSYEQ